MVVVLCSPGFLMSNHTFVNRTHHRHEPCALLEEESVYLVFSINPSITLIYRMY